MKKFNRTSLLSPRNQLISASILLLFSIAIFSVSFVLLRMSQPTTYQQGLYTINTPITAGSATVTINKISYSQGQGSYSAPAGKRYAVLNITFKNNAASSIAVLPANQIYLKDTNGKVYYLTPANLNEPFRAGELLAGDKITGELSYLIPNNITYQLYIDSIWSGGVVSVQLS